MSIKERELLERNPECRLIFYNPNVCEHFPSSLLDKVLCLNNFELMRTLNNKRMFREKYSAIARILESKYVKRDRCTKEYLRRTFEEMGEFVIQSELSSGGFGTVLVRDPNEVILDDSDGYLISKYLRPHIPVNVHAMIFEDRVMLFPASIQLVSVYDHKIIYRGADYIEYERISSKMRDQVSIECMKLCEKFREEGYRGVIGIDALIAQDTVYINEVNNRFQASTHLLNRAFVSMGLPSIQEMNLAAFEGKCPYSFNPADISVGYSNMSYIRTGAPSPPPSQLSRCSELILDGYGPDENIEIGAYQYRAVFGINVSSVINGGVWIDDNVIGENESWHNNIEKHRMPFLKIAVMNQGVLLSEDAERYFESSGSYRAGVYGSLDVYICDLDVVVNTQTNRKFVELSPFDIRIFESHPALYYHNLFVSFVRLDSSDAISEMEVNGTPLSKMCFLTTDRLRIQHTNSCIYEDADLCCKFCELSRAHTVYSFSTDDVKESVDRVLNSSVHGLRHILLGGATSADDECDILEICRHIRDRTDMPIYLMCIPPDDESVLRLYHDAGVDEIGINIEVYSSEVAQRIMPGKGAIPRSKYLLALKAAVGIWGKEGQVRSAFVVGLEPEESLIEGVSEVCAVGASPVLSPFRPIPGTPLEHLNNPPNEMLYNVLVQSDSVAKTVGVDLGPTCEKCRNNTLTM